MPDGRCWPRISIVTPSYNQGQFIEETIRSVLLQGYPNLEYVIMDGGSTDGSVDIIRKYADRLTWWCSEKDRGQANAVNKGWSRATGEIVAYLNSDDVYEPGAVRRVVRFLVKHPEVGIVYGNYNLIDANGTVRYTNEAPEFDFGQLLLGDYICQPTAFVRSNVIGRIGLLDSTLRYTMDYDFFLRAALEDVQFAKVPGPPLASFRMWQGTRSAAKSDAGLQEEWAILERCFASPKLPASLRGLRSEALARAAIAVAYAHYLSGEMKEARRFLRQALGIHPPIATKSVFLGPCAKTLLGARVSTWARQIRQRMLSRRRQFDKRSSEDAAK